MLQNKPPADSIRTSARLTTKATDPSPCCRWTSRNNNPRNQCNGAASPNKPLDDFVNRFTLLKRCLLELAREFPLDCRFLSKELSSLATSFSPQIVNSRGSAPQLTNTTSTQTTESTPPLFCEEISSILQQSMDLTVEQPGYKRAREEISNDLYRDNMLLNRQNLRLAQQIIELTESNESLNSRYRELSKKYEQLERVMSQMHEATTAVSRGADIAKDDLFGEYIRPAFSPRSSNLSSRCCFSPRSQLHFDTEGSSLKRTNTDQTQMGGINNDIATQTQGVELNPSGKSNNLAKKLDIVSADNKVKASMLERLEEPIGVLLEKEPGSFHMTLDNLDEIVELLSMKNWTRKLQRKPRPSINVNEEQIMDLAHCKSEGRLDPIPERGRKFTRRRQ